MLRQEAFGIRPGVSLGPKGETMLERFKVPLEDQVRVPEDALRETVAAIFEKVGVPADDAAVGADVLVSTDLRGVETHGVSNMLRVYVDRYRDGSLNPTPVWRIERETPGTATIDGDRGLGIIQGPRAMQMAIEKARKVGTGVVSMRDSGHLGAVGHCAMLAARQDMIGVCMTSGGSNTFPTFAAETRLGTNPISYAVPARNEPPVLFDAATSVIAGNKVFLAERVGSTLLPGWVADTSGTPIKQEIPVPPRGEYFHVPLGGTREQSSHKGYGFSMMAEVLCTMLSGGGPTMVVGSRIPVMDHYFAAYNIEAFTDLERFKDTMDQMLRTLKNTRPAEGHDRVLYPGLPEYEEEQERRANGIPLHREVIEWFDSITAELSLPRLRTM